jgi:hypothetical protein
LNSEQRVTAIAEFGFTARQARFLDVVMRHAGVCLLRQYSAFASIVHGQKTRAFFAKLMQRGYASAHECRHNRGRVYHVHHQALYRAIGEPHSRYRRPVSAARITARLAVLDAILVASDVTWLASGTDVQNHFDSLPAASSQLATERLERISSVADSVCSDTVRIGVDASGRTVVLCVLMPVALDDFRSRLGRLAPLLCRLEHWTLRLVLPREHATAYDSYQRTVHEEWETPFSDRTLEELNWYFEKRRTLPSGHSPSPSDPRFDHASLAFDDPRFDRLYRRWLRAGATALNDDARRAISEALTNDSGRVECLILNHAYDHLSPVIDTPKCLPVAPANDAATPPTARSIALETEARQA